jgi:membrane-bound serine protease (ClpP class)
VGLFHAWGLLALAFFLVLLELVVPSGGILGVCAGAAMLAAVVIGFLHSFTLGAAMLMIAGFGVPLMIWLGLKLWPNTPIGRRMLNIDPEVEAARRKLEEENRNRWLSKVGVAKINLLPNGIIEIDGQSLDAISLGGAIDHGTHVEVVNVIAGKIHVRPTQRPLTPPEPPIPPNPPDQPADLTPADLTPADLKPNASQTDTEASRPNPQDANAATPSEEPDPVRAQPNPNDVLEAPLESLGIEDWER